MDIHIVRMDAHPTDGSPSSELTALSLWIVAFHGQASICITSAFVEAMDTGGTKITPPL